jgi:hypothetical protein
LNNLYLLKKKKEEEVSKRACWGEITPILKLVVCQTAKRKIGMHGI